MQETTRTKALHSDCASSVESISVGPQDVESTSKEALVRKQKIIREMGRSGEASQLDRFEQKRHKHGADPKSRVPSRACATRTTPSTRYAVMVSTVGLSLKDKEMNFRAQRNQPCLFPTFEEMVIGI